MQESRCSCLARDPFDIVVGELGSSPTVDLMDEPSDERLGSFESLKQRVDRLEKELEALRSENAELRTFLIGSGRPSTGCWQTSTRDRGRSSRRKRRALQLLASLGRRR